LYACSYRADAELWFIKYTTLFLIQKLY
jgi:hypothetical protein